MGLLAAITSSTASYVLAGTFIFTGLNHLHAPSDSPVPLLGTVNLIYGTSAMILLSAAWIKPHKSLKLFALITGAIYLAISVVGSFDLGIVSPLELFSMFIVLRLVALNWFAVASVATYRATPNQPFESDA